MARRQLPRFFFQARQSSLHRALMHHETKALADVFSESRGVDIVAAGDRLLDENGQPRV